MANTYPVTNGAWLGSLPHLLDFSGCSQENVARLNARAFRLFSFFLTLKIAAPFVFAGGLAWPLSLNAVGILLVIVGVGLPRIYPLGLWLTLGLSFYGFVEAWPFTINHVGLELCILLLMCLVPQEESKPAGLSTADMIKILMLSVWFFSGLHKLFDGYYLNGEFFALEALANDGTLGYYLNYLLSFFGPDNSLKPLFCCSEARLAFTSVQIGILLGLSWLTILLEIFLPLSFLHNRWRHLGVFGLFIFQWMIGYVSGEIDFAFTAFAILFLFVPRLAPLAYPSLALIFLVVQPWA